MLYTTHASIVPRHFPESNRTMCSSSSTGQPAVATSATLRTHVKAEALYLSNVYLAQWAVERALRLRPDVERRLLRRMDRDDIHAIGQSVLWTCCKVWTPERGALTTLAAVAVLHALVNASQRRMMHALQLSAITNGDGDQYDPPAPETDDMAEALDQLRADRARLVRLLRQLPRRHREVLRLRWGLGGGEPSSLREIGGRLGVSVERVRQIEEAAFKRLRGGVCRHRRPLPVNSCSPMPPAAPPPATPASCASLPT
jgi:RNA polymerase sigma factor (sigma-70 family)